MARRWSPKKSQLRPGAPSAGPLLEERPERGDAGSGADHDH